jgi:hypothetical protein
MSQIPPQNAAVSGGFCGSAAAERFIGNAGVNKRSGNVAGEPLAKRDWFDRPHLWLRGAGNLFFSHFTGFAIIPWNYGQRRYGCHRIGPVVGTGWVSGF